MTNVPGFIPKPYPIVIFPGTFVIILQKVAVEFFRIMKSFPTTNFAEKNFRRRKMKCRGSSKTRFPKV